MRLISTVFFVGSVPVSIAAVVTAFAGDAAAGREMTVIALLMLICGFLASPAPGRGRHE